MAMTIIHLNDIYIMIKKKSMVEKNNELHEKLPCIKFCSLAVGTV